MDWAAQRGSRIAALTLPTGQQPPRYSILRFSLVRDLWLPSAWNAQRGVATSPWLPPLVVIALPLQVEDRSTFRYGVLDQSTKRYLLLDSSTGRYLLVEDSRE